MPSLAVVIPYFQRRTGILARCLRSVFAQEDCGDVAIFVVDDASPVSAASELATFGGATAFPVEIIERENGGPGAARNSALERLSDDVDYVAFLDSDDTWTTPHLRHAVTALRAGYDVYFADLYQLGMDVSAFERRQRLALDQHPPIDATGKLRAYQGDMFDQIMRGNVIGTPTVVYDFRQYADVRFYPQLRAAGEDYLFWMTLARRGARFAFSTEPEVRCGEGVNVYSGSGWGTESYALRVHNEYVYRDETERVFEVNAEQRDFLDVKKEQLRETLIMDCLHRVVHRKPLAWGLLRNHLAVDKRFLLAAPRTLAKSLVSRLRGKAEA